MCEEQTTGVSGAFCAGEASTATPSPPPPVQKRTRTEELVTRCGRLAYLKGLSLSAQNADTHPKRSLLPRLTWRCSMNSASSAGKLRRRDPTLPTHPPPPSQAMLSLGMRGGVGYASLPTTEPGSSGSNANGCSSGDADPPFEEVKSNGRNIDPEDGDDVDFTNASLYLSGMQTVVSICFCAVVSVLSCWIAPEGGVSAVRTLAFCVAGGVLLMRKPLQVGRVRGVRIVFSSLQPSIAIYLLCLVVEQLVHTCASDATQTPSWRRVVFHAMVLLMLMSGLMRARRPMEDTDLPFLITAVALLVTAMIPPPAVALVGPLCQPVGMFDAADRVIHALAFSAVYCAHVYASIASNSYGTQESLITVTRAASAALWTMGAHIALLPVAVLQCAVVIHARLALEEPTEEASMRLVASRDKGRDHPNTRRRIATPNDAYAHSQSRDDTQSVHSEDTELASIVVESNQHHPQANQPHPQPNQPHPQANQPQPQPQPQPTIGPLLFRDVNPSNSADAPPPPSNSGPTQTTTLQTPTPAPASTAPASLSFVSLSGTGAAARGGAPMSQERMAAIAATIDGQAQN